MAVRSRFLLLVAALLMAAPVFAQDQTSEPAKYKADSEVATFLSQRHLNGELRFVVANALFTLYHEVGHLLVDRLEWPIVGREEDVADNFATYTLLNANRRAYQQALKDSALGWQLSDKMYGGAHDASDYYDEHSLDLQRAYQIVCLMVGKDRHTFAITAQSWGIDRDRQHRCQDNYAKIDDSISRLLAPHRDLGLSADVSVVYERPDQDYRRDAKALRDSRLLESVAADLRHNYGLTRPLVIRGMMCGEPNAFYDKDNDEIQFCYELVDDFFYMIEDEKDDG